ncbi:MAG: ribokinase, partial [Dermatophilaceae bacterium]
MVEGSVDVALERLTGRVCVVGSINADLVVRVARLPRPGETLAGAPLRVNSGGKSANQAAAAARLGAHVDLVGAVGTDPWADVVTGALGDAGVSLDAVRRLTGSATGTAVITVDAVGENSIVISAGANGDLAPADVEAARDVIGAAGVLGLAFEVPPATVSAAALVAREAGVPVVLNPSPYRPPESELLSLVDVLVVNEHEAVELLGGPVRDWAGAGEAVRERYGVHALVVTLGSSGSVVVGGATVSRIRAVPITAVDTTGCGDAYMGALLAGLASGVALRDAAVLGSVVSALAATREGAQASYPTREEVAVFVRGS